LERLKQILPHHNCNDKAFTRSLHRLAQTFHVDYEDMHQVGKKQIRKEIQGRCNYGMMFAIMEGTHFWVYDMDQKKAVRVDIPKGAMVIFEGNCIHEGCYGPAYICFNSLICYVQEDHTKKRLSYWSLPSPRLSRANRKNDSRPMVIDYILANSKNDS
jgi:hypothetical protein